MTANASDNQVRRAVVSAFMKRIPQLMEAGKSPNDAIQAIFGTYQEIVERALFDRDTDKKPDQVDLLLLLQQDVVSRPPSDTFFVLLCSALYQLEILEEEAFEQWWADERSGSSEEMKSVKSQAKKFIEWLATADEEGSDEESEEESDEE